MTRGLPLSYQYVSSSHFQVISNLFCSGLFHLHNIWHLPIFQPIGDCLVLFLLDEVVAHDIVVVSTLSASFPPGFFGGRLRTYSPLFVLSLLLNVFVFNFLPSWPSEFSLSHSYSCSLSTAAKFLAFVCFNLLVDFFV